jgi:hypothetical protein
LWIDVEVLSYFCPMKKRVGLLILMWPILVLSQTEGLPLGHFYLYQQSDGRMGNTSGGLWYHGSAQGNVVQQMGIWVGGISSNGSVFANIVIDSGRNDFDYGPMIHGGTTRPHPDDWDKVFFITKEHIDSHIQNPVDTQETVYRWPANAPDGAKGPLSPFVDWNGNQIYEPQLGEYPVIEGQATILSVFREKQTQRSGSGGNARGLEFKKFDYIRTDSHLVVSRLLVSNYSGQRLDSVVLGIYAEVVLGSGKANLMRSMPDVDGVAVYHNGGGDSVFGQQVPAFTLQWLNRPASGVMYMDDDDNPITGFPKTEVESYRYLKSIWRNGKRLTYGGNGVDGTLITTFVFPDDRDPVHKDFPWTEENSGRDAGKRCILIHTPPVTLSDGQTVEYRYAMAVIPEAGQQIAGIREQMMDIKQKYQKGDLTSVQSLSPFSGSCLVYPNPVQKGNVVRLALPAPMEKVQVQWIRMDGSTIGSELLHSGGQMTLTAPSVSGMFLMRVITDKGVTVRRIQVID